MPESPLADIHRLVWTSLMAALIAVGAMTVIPVGPVPVTLQTLFVLLAGFALGPRSGTYAMLLYIAAGALGLPVFAGGKSGIAVLFGPTGGYLAGFVVMAWCAGMGGRRREGGRMTVVVAASWALAGLAAAYGLGALRLMSVLDIGMGRAVAVGVLPFMPGDLLKIVAAVAAWRYLRDRRLLP